MVTTILGKILGPPMPKRSNDPWFSWRHEFLCLCFGLTPAPKIFTKLLKIPDSVLRRLNIIIIIYLADMFLTGHTVKETLMTRSTVIFPL